MGYNGNLISLAQEELSLYQAGMHAGFAQARREFAEQLKKLEMHEENEEIENMVKKMAANWAVLAEKTAKTAEQSMDVAVRLLKQRKDRRLTLCDRLQAAIIGARDGWRGERDDTTSNPA